MTIRNRFAAARVDGRRVAPRVSLAFLCGLVPACLALGLAGASADTAGTTTIVHASEVSRPARIAVIYAGGETTGPAELRRAAAPVGVALTIFAPGEGSLPLADDTDLTAFDLVLVDGAAPAARQWAARIEEASARIRVAVVRPVPGGPAGNVRMDAHPWIAAYWDNASQDNYASLLRYLVRRVLDRPLSAASAAASTSVPASSPDVVAPPIVYPAQGFYHPAAAALFSSIEDYLAWYRQPHPVASSGASASASASTSAAPPPHLYDPAKLSIGIYAHIIPYQQRNVAHIDALVQAIEQRGHNAIVLLTRGSPEIGKALTRDGRPLVDVLLFTGERLNLKDRAAGLAEARALGVPVLSTLNQHAVDRAGFAALPNGLLPALAPIIVNAERDALFEPIVISGKRTPRDAAAFPASARAIEPFPAQVDWRVDRALAWAKLHRAANAEKRVVFTYWSEGGGKANAGGDPDDFLDVQASLVRLLGEMKARGYDVGAAPIPDRDTLARRMALESSNVGNWAPAELARRVAAGQVALVPEDTYMSWFASLPAARRDEIVEMWGPPPGDVMVHTDSSGRRFLVIPRLTFGHVLIAPHPDWGQLQNRRALMASGALPPHHQYLAFFFWLRHEWHADAWVSLFSNIVLQPGKAGGPAADDYVALLLGAMPHIHPERLGSNGGIANKRKGMALTPGWFNIVVPSDATEAFGELRAQLARHATIDDGPLRDEAAARMRREVVRTGVARAIDLDPEQAPMPALVRAVEARLDDLDRAQMPFGSKVLGDAPTGEALADMVAGMLGADLRRAIEALMPKRMPDTTAATDTGTATDTAIARLAGHDDVRREDDVQDRGRRASRPATVASASAPAPAPAQARLSAAPRDVARRLVAAVLGVGGTPASAPAAAPAVAPAVALSAELGRSSAEAEAVLARAAEYAERLRAAPREVASILDALQGRWIEPGPMNGPLRQPDAVPPGRVLYAFDQASYPTPEAEALGARQAESLIAAHREAHGGAWPTRLAFVLWSGEVARTQGVTEAQMFHLLGTRAVRNAQGEVTGVELIPRAQLGRPRVDVLATTSGTYRDNYQDKVDLIAQATALAAASPEADNPVAGATRAALATLTAAGESPERAAALSRARVFAPAPGAYSPGIQFLAKAGDARGDEARMAELYTSRMSHAYGAGLFGAPARATFERQLAGVEGATLPRSGEVNGMLDHPMSAGFLGGLNLAAHALTGKDMDLYVSRIQEADGAAIQSASSAIQTELRSRYLNPRWLAEMKAHGYDGARNMMFLTEQLDLWDSTAARTVSSADWADVKAVYVDDRHGLGLDKFFDDYNPHAQQMVLANLLGASSRGQWQASRAELAQVAGRLARSASAHGVVCEASVCRNPALTAQVTEALESLPDGAALATAYRAAIDRARIATSSDDVTASAPAASGKSTAAALTAAPAAAPAPTQAASGQAAASAPAAAPAPMSPAAARAPKSAPSASRAPSPSAAPSAATQASSAPQTITGRVLERVAAPPQATAIIPPRGWLWWGMGVAAGVLFACGWFRQPS